MTKSTIKMLSRQTKNISISLQKEVKVLCSQKVEIYQVVMRSASFDDDTLMIV